MPAPGPPRITRLDYSQGASLDAAAQTALIG